MTTRATISTDIRVVAAALVANGSIIRPAVITATGRAAPSQIAIVPYGVSASFALMPHADYRDVAHLRPGCGFVGSRISCIAPYLTRAIPGPLNLRVQLRMVPTSRDEIRRRLRFGSGLHWAPGALFEMVGWEDDWISTSVDRLRENGTESSLIIAHLQAMLALRKMWLTIIWGVDHTICRPASRDDQGPPSAGASTTPALNATVTLMARSGVVAVGRAMIDVVAIISRLIDEARARAEPCTEGLAAGRCLITLLLEFIAHLEAAEGSIPQPRKPGRKLPPRAELIAALAVAKTLLDAVAVFSVAAEPLPERWHRLSLALGKVAGSVSTGLNAQLDRCDRSLNRLRAAELGNRLERTGWRNHVRRALLRLASGDGQIRLARIDRIRGDLIYKLAITRRLDRLYNLFPWLAAPHGAFFGCAGGAIGALASLYECGRTMELGLDLKRDGGDAAHSPAAVDRLTVKAASKLLQSSRHIFLAAGRGYAFGRALSASAISHATMQGLFKGAWFGPKHPLSEARFGSLLWNLAASLKDPRTMATVQEVEATKPIMKMKSSDNLPRYMGMTLRKLIVRSVVSIFWGGEGGRSDFQRHRELAVAAARGLKRFSGAYHRSLNRATQGIIRSMQVTVDLDPETDPRLRDGIADREAPVKIDIGEAGQALRDQIKATSKSIGEVTQDGQGKRRRKPNETTSAEERGALLRGIIDGTRWWYTPEGKSLKPQDDLLEDILRGRANLAQLHPVADLPFPILWLAPRIDRDRLNWIARGAPQGKNASSSSTHSASISYEVGRAHAWAPLLYSRAFLTGRETDISCHLFTGRSPITADHSHVL